jgi:hypothetical protein
MKLNTGVVTILTTATILSAPPATAQAESYEYWISGERFTCTADSGRVPIRIDNYLPDLAISRVYLDGSRHITINDQQLGQMEPIVQAFVFAHECAHQIGPTKGESWADCWAASELRRRGIVQNYGQLVTIMKAAGSGPGSPYGHLPGPARAELIRVCSQ